MYYIFQRQHFVYLSHTSSHVSIKCTVDESFRMHAKAENKVALEQWFKYLGMEKKLKCLLTLVVNSFILSKLEDKMIDFANITMLDILQHLKNRGRYLDCLDMEVLKKEHEKHIRLQNIPPNMLTMWKGK